jgi:hypothetical protein
LDIESEKKKQPKRKGFAFVETFSFDTKTTFPKGLAMASPVAEAKSKAKRYIREKRRNDIPLFEGEVTAIKSIKRSKNKRSM